MRAGLTHRFRLVLAALTTALLPPVFCMLFTDDIRLTRAQNAVDGKDPAGRETRAPTRAPTTTNGSAGADGDDP